MIKNEFKQEQQIYCGMYSNKFIAVYRTNVMELKKYIENGEKKAGSQKELAKFLGITTGYIRNAKANKSGLPDVICIKLADYINEDRLEVIAASNLVTEKDEEKRRIFESCFNRAASIATAAIVISILTLPINKPVNAQEISGNLPFYKLSAITL